MEKKLGKQEKLKQADPENADPVADQTCEDAS